MSRAHVVGKGFLDLLDEVFWMLPFNSERQAARVRQDNNLLEKAWDARRKSIRSEHCLPHASTELIRLWEERILYNIANGASAPAAVEDVDDEMLTIENDS
jgi:hypothetical protein